MREAKAPKRKAGVTALIAGIIAATIALEGGYVNHSSDPGGETNMGITKRTAAQHGYTGPMRALPREVADSIYYQSYLVAPGYAPLAEMDAAVTSELFDTAVNMGPSRPSAWFQASINATCGSKLPIDGKVGAATIAAYRACQPRIGAAKLCRTMLDALDSRQRAEYLRLVQVRPKSRVFLKGWLAHRIGNVDRAKCEVRQ